MADIMSAIANIGLLKVIGSIAIIGLLVAAFAIGGGSKGGKGNKGSKDSSSGTTNQTTDGGSK